MCLPSNAPTQFGKFHFFSNSSAIFNHSSSVEGVCNERNFFNLLLYFQVCSDDVEVEDGDSNQSAQSASSTSSVASKSPAAPKATRRLREREEVKSALAPLYEELARTQNQIAEATGPNEKFAGQVAAVLNNIRDERIVKRVKSRIQLILSEAMSEFASRELAESELYSNTPAPVSDPSQMWWSQTTGPPAPNQPIAQNMSSIQPSQNVTSDYQVAADCNQSQDMFVQYTSEN